MSKRNIEEVDGEVAVAEVKRTKTELRDCIHLCVYASHEEGYSFEHYLVPVTPSKDEAPVDADLLFAAFREHAGYTLEEKSPDSEAYRGNVYLIEMVQGEYFDKKTSSWEDLEGDPQWEQYKVKDFVPSIDFFERRGFRCVATTTWKSYIPDR